MDHFIEVYIRHISNTTSSPTVHKVTRLTFFMRELTDRHVKISLCVEEFDIIVIKGLSKVVPFHFLTTFTFELQ